MRNIFVILAVCLFVIAVAVAQEHPGQSKPEEQSMQMMMPPKPGPEMAKMDYFNGTWIGDEILNFMGMPPNTKAKSKMVSKKALGGMYVMGDYSATMGEGKDKMNFEGHSIWYYDPQKKTYRQWWFDSMGPGDEMRGSWVDDKTFVGGASGEYMGKPYQSRTTYVIVSSAKFTMKMEMNSAEGWLTVMEGTYTKQTESKKTTK